MSQFQNRTPTRRKNKKPLLASVSAIDSFAWDKPPAVRADSTARLCYGTLVIDPLRMVSDRGTGCGVS